jgi:hypothetical protein
MKRPTRLIAAIATAALCSATLGTIAAASATPAAAGQSWNSISGNAEPAIQISSTPRHVTTAGPVYVTLSTTPGNMQWQLFATSSGDPKTSVVNINGKSQTTITTYLGTGTFYNGWLSSNGGNFSGKEWY